MCRLQEPGLAKAREYGAIIGLFALFTVAFFWRIFFTQRVFFPVLFDFANFNFPQNVFGVRSFIQGDFPLWNPLVSAGQPYVADPNIGSLYPLKLLFSFVLRDLSYRDMEFTIALHFFLTGIFTYALARSMGATRLGSVIAGFAFMFSGFLVAQMQHPNIIISTTWLPLVFLFFRRGVTENRVTDLILASVWLALSVLGGHPQFSMMMTLWIGIWMLTQWTQRPRRVLRNAGQFGLVLAVATAISAVQILPAVELIGQSVRGEIGQAEATVSSLLFINALTCALMICGFAYRSVGRKITGRLAGRQAEASW